MLWSLHLLYIFPPLKCLSHLLLRIKLKGIPVILFGLDWHICIWYTDVVRMLVDSPLPLPDCSSVSRTNLPSCFMVTS